MTDLAGRLRAIEGAPYRTYRDLWGLHPAGFGTIEFLGIQPDPFAPPSRLRFRIPLEATGLESSALSPESTLATEDFLARDVEAWLDGHPEVGEIVRIDRATQQVLRRTALGLSPSGLEILLTADLPGRGRRCEGVRAARAIAEGLPRLARDVLAAGSWDAAALARHRACVEDHAHLGRALRAGGWVAFVADGSRLARRSGDDDRPLVDGAVLFAAPAGHAAEIDLPHAGQIRGMAIPEGITLLCGGGFHGKSTLLRALAVAVYPHVPGDGRERVATDETAMSIRAEDGRAVHGIDLRPFLGRLPDGRDVSRFTTDNASGSTSQAAAIVEAIEIGCRCLLIDEDTSATNFLLRDPWMARFLRPDQEPIVPLVGRLREIRDRFGTSTILVVGGSGEAFRVADSVVVMNAYRPEDGRERMLSIRAEMGPGIEQPEAGWPAGSRPGSIRVLGTGRPRVRALDLHRIRVGDRQCDLSASGALCHPSQTRLLAALLEEVLADRFEMNQMPGLALELAGLVDRLGPGAVAAAPRGDLAEVRSMEIAMMMNRVRVPVRVGAQGGRGTDSPCGGYGGAC